jgi:4-amino-4-deoxychorismate lyase
MLIDGRPGDAVPAADRGLQYGDGLFETIAVFSGRPCLWTAHLARLAEGCARLGIPLPDDELLAREAGQLCQGVERGVLKLLITRGTGGRGYRPPEAARPRRILSLHPWPDYPASAREQGVRVRWCDTPLGRNPALAGIKHCNRLEQVLARAEWRDPAIAEGLMCDTGGRVIAGTMSNLFVSRDGRLLTPVLDECGVAGVARGQLMAAAVELGMECRVVPLSRDQVNDADALLLSNSLIGVWPVAELDGCRLDPGRWPRELIGAVMERVRSA